MKNNLLDHYEVMYIKRERRVQVVLLLLLLAIFVFSFGIGRYSISPKEIFYILKNVIFSHNTEVAQEQSQIVLMVVRIPRILLAMMVGGCLAVSGAVYQGVFRNPMLSSDSLGSAYGSAAGTVVAILLGLSPMLTHLISFSMGIATVLLVLFVTKVVAKDGQGTLLVMVLSGTVVSALCNSVITYSKFLADPDEKLPAIVYWLMGSFARSGSNRNLLFLGCVMFFSIGIIYILRFQMNVLSFGEEEAKTMGVHVKKVRMILMIASTLLTSASVCLCGIVPWVGIIVPHMARALVGPNYRSLIISSLLMGSIFMLLVDCVIKGWMQGEMPVGVVTSVIGAPLFLYMLCRERGRVF